MTLPYTSAAAPATVLGNSEAWPNFYIQKLCMPEAKNLPGRPLVPQPLQQGLSNFNLHKNHPGLSFKNADSMAAPALSNSVGVG